MEAGIQPADRGQVSELGNTFWLTVYSCPINTHCFEQGLDSILTDSLETPELDISLEKPDAITSSVSSGFLHWVSTISDTSKLQLAPSIRTHKLWCQARALLAPVSLATKMSASKLIHYFSSHPAAFGFQASTPPDNISLNSANRKVDQSFRFSDWSGCYCTCYS